MANLSSLAEEIVELIIGQDLVAADLCSLRLSCRQLEQKTSNYFSHVFFKAIPTDLSVKSLQKLKVISEHEQFREHVQILYLKQVARGQGENNWSRGFTYTRTHSGNLAAPLPGVAMLGTILTKGLVNCRTFECDLFHDDSSGCKENRYTLNFISDSDVLSIMLNVIATTGLPIQSFLVKFGTNGSAQMDPRRVDFKTLLGQRTGWNRSDFQVAWAQLQGLTFKYWMTPQNLTWTLDLVLSATSLKSLVLHLNPQNSVEFMRQLAAADRLSKVEHLGLECMYDRLGNSTVGYDLEDLNEAVLIV